MSTTPSAHSLSSLRFPPASGAIVGRRDEQQDEARIELFEAEGGIPALLLVVADGMGGHAGGRDASRVAVDAFARTFHAGSGGQFRSRLREALEAANQAVAARAGTSRELRGMGCTIVAAVLAGNYLRWISVGDSLLLAIKDRQVVRLNADHSLAPELDRAAREGRISQEEADRDPERHVLRSAVTGARLNMVDEGARRLGDGALVLLATDGILTLPSDRLARIASEGKAAERTVEELLSAIEVGMPPDQDNATLVAAYCEGAEGMARRRRRQRRGALGLVALLVAVLAGTLATYILIGGNWEDDERAPRPPSIDAPRQDSRGAPPRMTGDFDGRVFRPPRPASRVPRKSPRPPPPETVQGRTKSPTSRPASRGVRESAGETSAPAPAPAASQPQTPSGETARSSVDARRDRECSTGMAFHRIGGDCERSHSRDR